MPDKTIVWTDCSGCPCLNNDSEYGNECNLGYTTEYLRIQNEPPKFCRLSHDCKLIRVITEDTPDYFPDKGKLKPIPSEYDRQLLELFETELISEDPRIVRIKDKYG
jgi:hypothetical protein